MIKRYSALVQKTIDIPPQMLELAKELDYPTFLKKLSKLDEWNILYRGTGGIPLQDKVFMTDWLGHAYQYSETVNGILYGKNEVLFFEDVIFNNLKSYFKNKGLSFFKKIYSPYFKKDMLSDAMLVEEMSEKDVIKYVITFLKEDIPYSQVSQTKNNDLLIPLMIEYAQQKGFNIIAFLGGDYFEYGGQNEFVVNDISKYPQLLDIWESVNLDERK